MNYDHPIEQLVQRADTRFQLGFATEAKERIPPSEEFVLQPSREGLRVLGRNEESLTPRWRRFATRTAPRCGSARRRCG